MKAAEADKNFGWVVYFFAGNKYFNMGFFLLILDLLCFCLGFFCEKRKNLSFFLMSKGKFARFSGGGVC
jgi:hypothetical protein